MTRRHDGADVLDARALAARYEQAHDRMRNIDGLQPQEAFDELLKYLLVREVSEGAGRRGGLAQGAKAIRRGFAEHARRLGPEIRALWGEARIRLSDAALVAMDEAFGGVSFRELDCDVRSAALRMFLGPDLRRGLGIYLTPDEVVRAIVRAAAPGVRDVVYDPACGSGTFLLETLEHWRTVDPGAARRRPIYGSDINARMTLLARLNLGSGARFRGRVMDALAADREPPRGWPRPGSVDVILTNPPFGVYVEGAAADPARFSTRGGRAGGRLPSEVLFLEQCLRWLRPEGLLAIVVPRSVLTNETLAGARAAIDELAVLAGVLALPPETFAATGTQTTTAVLFLRKRPAKRADARAVGVPVVEVANVGVDATGRARAGSQLDTASRDLAASMRRGVATGMARLVRVPEGRTLAEFATASRRRGGASGRDRWQKLGDVIELAQTGRTPARAAYVPSGVFALKVGNLTGQGIDWAPRERNFVDPAAVSPGLWLADGDLVLTSSAHNPRYIAQKVDIVHSIPAFSGGRATFVGEVLRLRVRPGALDSYALLAYLRRPDTRARIQDMVRGQTAHLRPRDLLELPLDLRGDTDRLIELLRQEAELARQLNLVMAGQRSIYGA